MKKIVRTPQAVQDLLEAWEYIAVTAGNPSAASGVLRRIDAVLEHLLKHPEIGERYQRRQWEVRLFPVGSYILVYRSVDMGIELIRVLHGARQWEELL
jgi:toxin ParE1/3/4